MSPYLTFGILFSLALLQSTVVPRLTLLGVHPDLMLLAVTSWSLLSGSTEGMLWALVGGLITDLFSGAPFGVCTLPLLIVGFLAGLGEKNVFRLDLLIPILVIPPASLLYGIAMWALLRVVGWPAAWGQSLHAVIFPSVLVNTLAMPIVYFALRVLHRRRREVITW